MKLLGEKWIAAVLGLILLGFGSQHGEILTTGRVLAGVENLVETESAGEQTIRGFTRPIQVIRVLQLAAVGHHT